MKAKLLKKVRKKIKLHHDKSTGNYYIYDADRGDIYSTDNDKIYRIRMDIARDKRSSLEKAKEHYRDAILSRARFIYLPIRIKKEL